MLNANAVPMLSKPYSRDQVYDIQMVISGPCSSVVLAVWVELSLGAERVFQGSLTMGVSVMTQLIQRALFAGLLARQVVVREM